MSSRALWLVTWWDNAQKHTQGYIAPDRKVAEEDIKAYKEQGEQNKNVPVDINLFKLSLGKDGKLYVKKCVVGSPSSDDGGVPSKAAASSITVVPFHVQGGGGGTGVDTGGAPATLPPAAFVA